MNWLLFLQKETPKKKKIIRTDVAVNEAVVGGLPQADLEKCIEKEYEMALQDRVMEETKDKKNAVEAYVYDMRNKVTFICLWYMLVGQEIFSVNHHYMG